MQSITSAADKKTLRFASVLHSCGEACSEQIRKEKHFLNTERAMFAEQEDVLSKKVAQWKD